MAYNPLTFGLMMTGTAAILFVSLLWHGREHKREKGYGVIFFVLGVIGLMFTWLLYSTTPILGHYLEVFGVAYAVFSALMLCGGVILFFNLDTTAFAYLAAVCGVILLKSAHVIYVQALTLSPFMSSLMFALCGFGLVCIPVLNRTVTIFWRVLVSLPFLGFALIAIMGSFYAQTGHVVNALSSQ